MHSDGYANSGILPAATVRDGLPGSRSIMAYSGVTTELGGEPTCSAVSYGSGMPADATRPDRG